MAGTQGPQARQRRLARARGSVVEPYAAGVAVGRPSSIKTSLRARVAVVLDTRRDRRALDLIYPQTRCIRASEVHELIATSERNRGPGDQINRVAGIGFVIFKDSGVIMVGDEVSCRRLGLLGVVVGFDTAHYPNHFNIVLEAAERQTGREFGLHLGDALTVRGQPRWAARETSSKKRRRPS